MKKPLSWPGLHFVTIFEKKQIPTGGDFKSANSIFDNHHSARITVLTHAGLVVIQLEIVVVVIEKFPQQRMLKVSIVYNLIREQERSMTFFLQPFYAPMTTSTDWHAQMASSVLSHAHSSIRSSS